ncbi:MAG TPA: GAF domain-containing protein, partial [Actinomycetales bacterium]
ALTDLTLRTGIGLVPDVDGDPRVQGAISGIGGYLGVPIVIAGLAVGVLSVDQGASREWSPQDVVVLRQLAHNAGNELELRAVTAELALAATRLDVSLRAADVGGYELNAGTGELWWDERVVEMFGYDADTFTGRIDSFEARLHPDDRDRVTASIQAVLDQGGEMAEEYRVRLPNGVTRWISARGRRLVSESGEVHLVGAVFDSTSMHLTRDRVARVIETMTDAYYSVDRDWRFTYVNNRAEKLLGRQRADLVGALLWDELPHSVGTETERCYRQVMDTGQPLTFEEHYPPPVDCRFELRAWATPDGVSVVFHDISDRHRDQLGREQALADVQAAHARLELLSDMTRALVSTLDVDEALGRLLDLLVPRLGDWCTVALADEGGEVRHCVGRHRDPALAAEVQRITELIGVVTGERSKTSTVLRTGQPLMVNDSTPRRLSQGWEGDELTHVLERLQMRHVIVVPLTSRERVLGIIILTGAGERPGFTEQDLTTATEVGRLAGLAIDNAQLYDRQRSAVEMLQRHLLPPLPQVPGLAITARYVAAATQAQVGGDFYWGALGPGAGATVAIGDVAGHDLAATSW